MSASIASGWAIRPATELELSEIVVLERETGTAPHWSWAEYSALVRGSSASGLRRCLYVAAEGRTILGFAVGSAFGVPGEVEAELESVVVRAAMRREGLGSALCRAVMEWSRGEGALEVKLEVRAGSAGALKLYGGLGFVASGRRPRYYDHPTEDGVMMHCTLSPAHAPAASSAPDGQSSLFGPSGRQPPAPPARRHHQPAGTTDV